MNREKRMFFLINVYLLEQSAHPRKKTFHGIFKLTPITYYSRSTMSCTQWVQICCAGLVLLFRETSGCIFLGAKMTIFCFSTCLQNKLRNFLRSKLIGYLKWRSLVPEGYKTLVIQNFTTLVMRFLWYLYPVYGSWPLSEQNEKLSTEHFPFDNRNKRVTFLVFLEVFSI